MMVSRCGHVMACGCGHVVIYGCGCLQMCQCCLLEVLAVNILSVSLREISKGRSASSLKATPSRWVRGVSPLQGG